MATNLDRLFRENLDQLEVTPSADSWSRVKGQLTKKQPVWVIPMRIAAAVALLVTVSWIIFNHETPGNQQMISGIDHPVQAPAMNWTIEYSTISLADPETQPTKNTKQSVAVKNKKNQAEKSAISNEPMNILLVTGLDTPLLDIDKTFAKPVLINGKATTDPPKIKITYIASEQPAAGDSTKTSKLSRVFALAKEVTSSDLLADLRDVKDNLFSKN